MKRIAIALLLGLCTLLLFSCKEPLPETGDFECEFDTKNKTAAVTAYKGNEESVVIPESFGKYTVTAIGRTAFKENYDLSEITLPETLENIEGSAFELCIGLKNVTLPDSVKTLGNTVFANCRNLETVTLSKNLENIGICVFTGCTDLTEIKLNGENASFKVDEFGVLFSYDETRLIQYPLGSDTESYEVPKGVTYIESYAFEKAQNLDSVTLPSTVKTVGSYAFQASSVTSIILSEGVLEIGSFCFNESKLKTIELGTALKKIGESAFAWCTSLESVKIPETVEEIGKSAFYMCNAVTEFSVNGESKYFVSDSFGALFNKDMTTLLCYPTGSKEETYTIPDTVREIAPRSFSSCIALKTVIVPDSVTTVGEYAFENCANLKNVNYRGTKPENISENAFGNNNG